MTYVYQIKFVSCNKVAKIIPVPRREVVDFMAELVLAGASEIRLITKLAA